MQQYRIADGRDQQVDADRVIRGMLIDELQSAGRADWIGCGSRIHITSRRRKGLEHSQTSCTELSFDCRYISPAVTIVNADMAASDVNPILYWNIDPEQPAP